MPDERCKSLLIDLRNLSIARLPHAMRPLTGDSSGWGDRPQELTEQLKTSLTAAGDASNNNNSGPLHLPAENWAIPNDLSMRGANGALVKQPEDGTIHPTLVTDRCGLKLWHCKDISFGMPKVCTAISLGRNGVHEFPSLRLLIL